MLNASSSEAEDFTVTLTMNNLQQFKFTPGENMILSFPEELNASKLNTSVIKIKQNSSDLSKIVITYPADFLREAERGTKKFDISPKVVFKHPKIGIDFCTYDSFKVICNSAPTMPSGAVLYKDSSDDKYVICFNLPDKNAMKSGAKDSDIKKLRIDDTDYDITVNADGTFSFSNSNPNFLQAPTPAQANSNYVKVDSSHDFIPNGQPVYFKTSDSIGSNPVYKIEIFDETIGSGAVTVGASMHRLKEPEVSKKDSHDVFTSLNAAAENEIPVSSDGSSYVYITPPSEYATGGAVQDVSVVYELWRGHNKLEKISDGTVTAAQSPVAVPGGKTLLRVYAYKDGAVDSSVKEYKLSVLIYAYYVKGEGASVLSGSAEDTNEGTKSYPLKTVHAAIQKINALPSATEQYTVFVDGSAAEDNAITVGGSSGGTSARKIEIKRLDSATAEIHRASAASPAGALFTVEKDSNLKFTNITIDGKNLSLSGNEMVSRGNIDFEGCLVQNYDAQSHHVLHIENGTCKFSDTVMKSTASKPQAYVYIDRTSSASPTITVKKSVKIGGTADFSSVVLNFYEDSSNVESAYITADGLSADSYINVVPYKYDKQFGKTLVKGANASSYKGYFHVAGSSEDGGRYFLEAGNDGGTDNALILKKSIVISGDEPNAWAKLKYNAENASDGETIVVTGTIKAGKTSTEINGTSFNNFGEIKISKNITIRANGTPAVIDADKTTDGKSAHRIFTVSGAGVKLTLQNVTLQGGIASGTGEAGYGGAVYVKEGTTLELKECNVKDNSATMGGGVYVEKGSFTLENSGVQNCQSSGGKKYGVYVKAYAGGGAQPVFKVKGAVKIGSASDSTAVCLGWDTDTGAVVTAQNLAAGAHINLVPENYVEQYGKALVRSTDASFPTAAISSFSLTDAPAGKAVFRLMAGTASGTQSALLLRETVTIDGNADENAWAYLKYYSAHILPGDDIIVKNTVKAKVGGTVSINGVNEQTDGKIHVGSDVLIWAKGTGATLDASNKDSIFEFDGTGSGNLTLKNLTLKNGEVAGGYNGGVVLVKSDKTLVLENCIIQDCSAGKGGALYIEKGGKCVLSGTTLSGNKASGMGGAVYVEADSSKAGKLSILGTSVITKENDVGTGKYNDVCLETGAVITVTGTLSGSVTARITPKTYMLGRIVVQGEGFTLPSDYVNRFTVTEENGNTWNLEKDGNALKLKTSTLIVDGGAHTNDAWKFLKEQVQAAPENSTIIIKGSIKATAAQDNNGEIEINKKLTIKAKDSSATLDANSTSTGSDTPTAKHRIFKVTGAELILDGVKLQNGKANGTGTDGKFGGAILIKQDAKCAITDCELSSSEAGDKGGAIYVEKGAECTITNTKIDGNKATGMGGGVYVEAAYGTAAAGKCVISGGSFTNNEANGGGGGAIYTAGTLAITGCTIGDTTGTNGNKATGLNGGGGGINIFKGTCTLTNVTMEGNTLAGNSKGSGVYLYSSAGSSTTFTVKGATKIGSSTDTNAVLVVLTPPTQVAVNVDGLMDAHINLEPVSYNFQKNEELVKGDGASSYKGYFHLVGVPSGETWSLKPNADGKALLLRKQEVINGGGSGTWKKLKTAVENALSGDVILVKGEIEATNAPGNNGEISVPAGKSVTIQKDGSAAIINADNQSRIFKVTDGAELILDGVKLQNGKATGSGDAGNGGGVYVDGGKLTLINGASITSCSADSNGGGVFAKGSSTVLIESGDINSNTATNNGGGIFVENGSQVTLGKTDLTSIEWNINSNTAAQKGGGIYSKGTLKIYYGQLSQNTAKAGGGAIYLEKGTVTLEEGEGAKLISNITDDSNGGAIYVDKEGTLNVKSASIIANRAQSTGTGGTGGNGGGIFVTGDASHQGKVIISKGTIASNEAESNSTNTGFGGGICAQGGSVTMSGGTLKENTAIAGGGVALNQGGTLTLSGSGGINDNTATIKGGGICAEGASDKRAAVTIDGGTINMNKASGSNASGGGIYVNQYADITLKGSATVSGNTATGSGIGVYNDGGTFTMSGAATVDTGNDVYLGGTASNNAMITVTGALSNTRAAKLTPSNYAEGNAVVKGSSEYTLQNSDIAKFPITAQTALAQDWTTELDSVGNQLKLKKKAGATGTTKTINGADSDAWTKLKTEVEKTSGGAEKIIIQGTVQATTAHNGEITVSREVEIEGNGTDAVLDANLENRIFKVNSDDANLKLTNITLRNGNVTKKNQNGGAILFTDGIGVFSKCIILSCSSNNFGGAIALTNKAALEITDNSIIKNCNAKYKGGGLYIIGEGDCTLKNSSIKNCHATNNDSFGGGAWLEESKSKLVLNDSLIESCTSKTSGGGIYIATGGTCTFEMSGSAKVTVSTEADKNKDGANEIYFQGGEIKVRGTLSAGDGQAARITVYNPSDGKTVLTGDTAANCTKFAVTPNGGQNWYVNADGKLTTTEP